MSTAAQPFAPAAPFGADVALERARSIVAVLEAKTRSTWPTLARVISPQSLAAAASGQDVRYGELPAAVVALLDEAGRCSTAARELCARMLFASLAAEARTGPRSLRLPPSVSALYPMQLERILDAIEDPSSPADLAEDRWKKNYAILTGRLIPVGAEFADPGSGIPRSLLFRGPVGQRVRLASIVALRTRGFRPLFELHAHPDSLGDFTPEGWLKTYHRVAELLQMNPGYKGVMASSWFRDPQLATISPKLRYLRAYPERHGARMLLVGHDFAGTSGALARSPTRQRLFREGKYVPTIHMMIWPRDALLRWHAHTKDVPA